MPSIPKLDDHAANVLLHAAWQVHERETHDIHALLNIVLPDVEPTLRASRFEQVCNTLDNAVQAETDGYRELVALDIDDAVQRVGNLLRDQAAASIDRALAIANSRHLSVAR
jgi:non-ribosomal peptide synthetase component F